VPLDSGTRVGRFSIRRLVAQGGMAEVYLADQELTPGIKRPAAVKVIRPEYSESEDFREMFLDEARTACTLSHPNIAHIYEVGETDDGLLFMAMEFVPGETLATINRTLRDHGERFSDEALFTIGINTCAALEAVHALNVEGGTVGLVHRDVSPHNLLLSPTGALKLIDFGIAKAATNRNLTMPGVTKGKAGYFSPEQAMGKKLDGRSDLFSLGITLYKLASGQTPFDDYKNHAERHAALVRGQWERLEKTYPGMSQGFYEVIDHALMVKPEGRFQTAREMREALEKAAFDAGIRVSQSSLIGYVDDDGEVTATGGSRSSSSVPIAKEPTATKKAPRFQEPTPLTATPLPVPPLPSPKRGPKYDTERLPPGPRPKALPLPWLLAAFAAAVLIGGAGIFLVLREPAKKDVTPPPPGPTVVDVKPPDVRQPPDVVAPPVDVMVVEVEKDAGVSKPVAMVTPPRHPKKDRHPPVVKVEKPDKPPVKPPVEKVEKPPVKEEIPAGQGKLRLGEAKDNTVKAFLVGGKEVGSPPLDVKVPSGYHTVAAKLVDGRLSAPWKGAVWPDRTTVLVYDATSGRWSAR